MMRYLQMAALCITTEILKRYLPNSVQKLLLKMFFMSLAKVLKKIYPFADIDYPDLSLKVSKKTNINLLNLVIMF